MRPLFLLAAALLTPAFALALPSHPLPSTAIANIVTDNLLKEEDKASKDQTRDKCDAPLVYDEHADLCVVEIDTSDHY